MILKELHNEWYYTVSTIQYVFHISKQYRNDIKLNVKDLKKAMIEKNNIYLFLYLVIKSRNQKLVAVFFDFSKNCTKK
jgi:hypothetical protein